MTPRNTRGGSLAAPTKPHSPFSYAPFVVGSGERFLCRPLRGGSADVPDFFMKKTLVARMKQGIKLAYRPGKNPKRSLPGPFFDLSVVGLFVILVLGYLLR